MSDSSRERNGHAIMGESETAFARRSDPANDLYRRSSVPTKNLPRFYLKGLRFGRLLVLERSDNDSQGRVMWLCLCDCGNNKSIRSSSLRNGDSTSCGCFKAETCIRRSTTHGLHGTRAYALWSCAKHRAKVSGIPFNITPQEVIIPLRCPVFGWEFKSNNTQGPLPTSPTLDRIDSSRGYVSGNVWVISHRANTLKSDASLQELQQLVAAINTLLAGAGLAHERSSANAG